MWTEGLRFKCTLCHACCRHDPGYVFLSSEDIHRLCTFLKIDESEFLQTYCRCVDLGSGPVYSLKEKPNYDCVFWDQGCTVYPGRPLQCQTYPFWGKVVATELSWKRESQFCPGINQGPEVPREKIEEYLRLMSQNTIRGCTPA